MSHADELFEETKRKLQKELEEVNKAEILQGQNFLKEMKARRWNIVSIGFGDQLIKKEDGTFLPLNETYSINDMKKLKGLNYGSHEFSYDHFAVILGDLNISHIHKTNTIIVAPISSTFRRNSVLLEKKHHTFLERDSYILLEHISNIGIERIKINLTKRFLIRPGYKILHEISAPVRIQIHNTIEKVFGIK